MDTRAKSKTSERNQIVFVYIVLPLPCGGLQWIILKICVVNVFFQPRKQLFLMKLKSIN